MGVKIKASGDALHVQLSITLWTFTFDVVLCFYKEGHIIFQNLVVWIRLQKFGSPSIQNKYFCWPSHFFPDPIILLKQIVF